MKNLIYYSIGFNVDYNKLLELSLISLKKFYDGDIVIITDNNNMNILKTSKIFNSHNISFLILNSTSIFDSTLNKFKIFEYEKINMYDNVLYLDCDTIVINELDMIFNNTQILKKISIVEEVDNVVEDDIFNMGSTFFSGEFEGGLFDENDKKMILQNNIKGLNTGVFCININNKSKQLLSYMSNHYIKNYNSNIIFNTLEQPYMNYYLFKYKYYVTINNYVKIIHLYEDININNIHELFLDKNLCILHFVGPGPGQFYKKYKFMLSLFPHKITKYIK